MKSERIFVSAESVSDAFSFEIDSTDTTDTEDQINFSLVTKTNDLAYTYGTFRQHYGLKLQNMNLALSMGEEEEFSGLIIDTGANMRSAMSIRQYRAYCFTFGVPMKVGKTNRSIKGVGGHVRALGIALVPVPFPKLGVTIDVKFLILSSIDTPTLLSLRDMRENNIGLDILEGNVTLGKEKQPLSFVNGFWVYNWQPEDSPMCLFTEEQLLKLHRSFGHPSVNALTNVLNRARPEEDGSQFRKLLSKISQNCHVCSMTASKPRHFKLTIGSEDIRFNHCVALDVMYLIGRPVLHVVCEQTHYQAARFLKNMSADETWRTFSSCWRHTYLGPPDFIRVDQGTNFVAEKFASSAMADGIQICEAPVESPETMSHCERYHGPLRVSFNRIKLELKDASDEDILQQAVKVVNDTVGPEGLTPTLLVYGSIPRPARCVPAPTQLERARAMENARKEVLVEYARRRIAFGLKHKGPVGGERQDLKTLQYGAKVAIYRDKSGWTGPERFISMDGDTVIVHTEKGRTIFRSTVVKPWVDDSPNEDPVSDKNVQDLDCSRPGPNDIGTMFGETEFTYISDSPVDFTNARASELRGLLGQGMFKIVKRSQVPELTRIYDTRWVDVTKEIGGNIVMKSRLVAKNFRDQGARSIPTRSPTVSKAAQRIVLATAASMIPKGNQMYVRDISQAYTQSETLLERDIYLNAPVELKLSDDEVLLCLRPLYGIPESGFHWFLTYVRHHVKELEMTQSKADRCLLYRMDKLSDGMSVTALQVDDNLGHGTKNS
jgi:hypothetical protein